ncbi:MAG TPA: hypothetical protein VFH78_13080 [Candidatus Thermoplasmatota archaeon]|nr:hypothetical protein [Candidatus Thermoplasmatota archaeon]
MRLPAALLAALLLAGCAAPGGGDAPRERTPPALEAPWWNIGESWTIQFQRDGGPARTTTLVNFANNTFGDPPHFWLGTADRQEALDHVFFDNNPFLGRIHHLLLAPHEKGMHSQMYEWPLREGGTWTSPILFGHRDILVTATERGDGTVLVQGQSRADGTSFEYDYDPKVRWFRELKVADGQELHARVVDHKESGARGTFHFLRGRDYLDADGGRTGEEETFQVTEEGATSIAFLLDVRTATPASIEFVDPSGRVVHRETIALGGTADKVVEIREKPQAGTWKLRYLGNVQGEILVRGVIEYKATL